MSGVALLLGLLVVAYVGSQLMGGRAGGYRLPSGAEYLLLGLALGPHALATVERSTLDAFEPLVAVGTAWLTLVIGADHGFQGNRRVSVRGHVVGVALSLVSVSACTLAVYAIGRRFALIEGHDLLLVSAGIGLTACETARHAVRWVLGRHAAEGPLSRLVGDIADSDDVVPILGLAVLLGTADHPEVALTLPWWAWSGVTLGVGVVLGVTAAALLRAEPRASDGWGVLIGAGFLGTGIAWRLGLAPQAVTFALGVSLSVLSRHGAELRAMLAKSEEPVLLPMLLLAGALVEFDRPARLAALVAIAFAARVAIRLAAAPVIAGIAGVSRSAAPSLALGLLPSGALSITIGLAFVSRFDGKVGDIVLAVAVALALLGELVGPSGLRRALVRVGEIRPEAPAAPEAEPVPSPSPAVTP